MDSDDILTGVSLSPQEISLLAEYDAAIRDITAQARGALTAMVRYRELEGNWTRQGDMLVRAE